MRKTVLLVDDSAETRRMYAVRLRDEGYDVLEAPDGEAGIRVASENRPDLIFMNMALPELDGWSAIALLKQNDRTAGIPIVALTGFDEQAARARAEEVGSDGFIGKPCEPSRLLEEVQRRLAPAEPG
ncbi:MAG: response regulator [Gemmatimonadetes bacterium]|nr:response regulator [Gemmatimonadota bacterium]